MNARRYASLIVLGWMALAPARAGAEDPSPPAPLPPRAPEAPKPPKPEESDHLAARRRLADLMARFEKAKDAGQAEEMRTLARELAILKLTLQEEELARVRANIDLDRKKAADEAADLEAKYRATRAEYEKLLAGSGPRGAGNDAETKKRAEEGAELRAKMAASEDALRAKVAATDEALRAKMGATEDALRAKMAASEDQVRAKVEALHAQGQKLAEALADAQARGAEKDADALRAQAKQVEEQAQALILARRRGARDGETRPTKDWQPPSDDPAQMQQRLMRLQQAIRLLMEAGLPERANAVEKDAERLKAAMAARASSPEGDLLLEIHSLREEVQQMRRELHDLREMLERK